MRLVSALLLSTSYNATVTAICQEVVDPFNGFWASIGWCCLLYLPAILLSVSLISLYRKVEPYPGPLMEAQPLHNAGGTGGEGGGADKAKGRRKGHTRNPSGYLPEYTHARPPPQQMVNGGRFRDIAPANWDREATSQPPRYTSTPSLPGGNPGPAGEYERPPPYYYPGPAPTQGSKWMCNLDVTKSHSLLHRFWPNISKRISDPVNWFLESSSSRLQTILDQYF